MVEHDKYLIDEVNQKIISRQTDYFMALQLLNVSQMGIHLLINEFQIPTTLNIIK